MSVIGNFFDRLGLGQSKVKDDVESEEDRAREVLLEIFNTTNTAVVQAGLSIMISAAIADIKGLGKDLDSIKRLNAEVEKWRVEADKVIAQVNKVMDSDAVQRIVEGIERANAIGLIISPAYRRQVANFQTDIRNLSKQVFKEASTITAQLTVVQMLIYDINRLEGKNAEEGEVDFINASVDIAKNVKDKARAYNRNPGLFWFDLQNEVVNPLYAERSELERKQGGLLDNTLKLVSTVSEDLIAVDDRLSEYIEPLREFQDPTKMRELDNIRKNFRRDVIDPIAEVVNQVDTTFPLIINEIEQNAETIAENEEVLVDVTVLLSEPEVIEPEEQRLQRARFLSIFNSVMTPGVSGVPSIDEAMEKQAGIYDRIVSGEIIE
jgi:ribosomal 50S subunit-associated protein YjgA (DUF615 family)